MDSLDQTFERILEQSLTKEQLELLAEIKANKSTTNTITIVD